MINPVGSHLEDRLAWYAPWWSYGPERFRALRRVRLWGLRAWLGWIMLGYGLIGVGAIVLLIVHPAAIPHIPLLLPFAMPVMLSLVLLSMSAQCLIPPRITVRPGQIRIEEGNASKMFNWPITCVRIETTAQGRCVLHLEWTKPNGRARRGEYGLARHIDPRTIKLVFERGSTMTLEVIEASPPDQRATIHPAPAATTPNAALESA
jgi:hypothetical protein